jgi:hypothetical protein
MKRLIFCFILLFSYSLSHAQEDWGWWNDLHGWEAGMPNWRSFITVSPGFLGPNALPVPEVAKGIVEQNKTIELSSDFHIRTGDQTQNLSGQFYFPFSDKIAIELYGVIVEHYSMSDSIRDERAARDRDGEGLAVGDLYFATYVQLVKGRKFPNTMLRMAGKTASGGRFDAARYSDSPGYYFDLSFSKEIPEFIGNLRGLPFWSFGFYSWQTNDLDNLQNDAFMYSLGIQLENDNWELSNSLSGYSGYKNERDQPMIYTLSLKRNIKKNAIKFEYIKGIQDYEYQTIKLAYLWRWK